jgi:hypothetical protein
LVGADLTDADAGVAAIVVNLTRVPAAATQAITIAAVGAAVAVELAALIEVGTLLTLHRRGNSEHEQERGDD